MSGFTFGNPSAVSGGASASTGFSFGGATPAAAAAPAGGGFSFGNSTAAAPAAGNLFGTSTPALAAATTQATGFSFGSTSSAVTTTTAAGNVLSFGSAVSVPSSSATTVSSSGSGLGGMSLAATGGLGSHGIAAKTPTGAADGGASAGATSGSVLVKDQPIPPEILRTVELMRTHIKTQKSECEAIARHSWTPVQRCADDTLQLCQLRSSVEASVQRHTTAVGRLKRELWSTLAGAEVAQRTADTAAALQYENTAPSRLFDELLTRYQTTLAEYRRQIDHIQQLLSAADTSRSVASSPEDVVAIIKRQHETFVWLASRMYSMHERVGHLKEQLATLMRHGHQITGINSAGLPAGTDKAVMCPAPLVKSGSGTDDKLLLMSPSQMAGPSPFSTPASLSRFSSLLPSTSSQQLVPLQPPVVSAASFSAIPGLFGSPSLPVQQQQPGSLFGSSPLVHKSLTSQLDGLSSSSKRGKI